MKTEYDIKIKLEELKESYENELKNGSKENASDFAKEIRGKIQALKWVIRTDGSAEGK